MEVSVNPLSEWPDNSEEHQLLTQLHSNTPPAREAVTVRFLPLMMCALARMFPHIEPELRDTAAADAVFDFVRRPNCYDVNRGSLGTYLRMAARRDLLNLLEQERRTRRGISLGSVEEPPDHRNQTRDDELTWNHPILVAELAALDADEQVALELMRDGVRKTTVFVNSLGLAHLSRQEQVTAVTRLKDRVKRRLTRALEELQ
jgi:hypothetical protein